MKEYKHGLAIFRYFDEHTHTHIHFFCITMFISLSKLLHKYHIWENIYKLWQCFRHFLCPNLQKDAVPDTTLCKNIVDIALHK